MRERSLIYDIEIHHRFQRSHHLPPNPHLASASHDCCNRRLWHINVPGQFKYLSMCMRADLLEHNALVHSTYCTLHVGYPGYIFHRISLRKTKGFNQEQPSKNENKYSRIRKALIINRLPNTLL